MTNEEAIEILKAHKRGVEAAKDFESFKAHQISYIEMLIEEKEGDVARADKILSWVVNMETRTDA